MTLRARKISFLIMIVVMLMALLLAACSSEKPADESVESAKPSNGGGPGQAVTLTGDATKGAQVFVDTCVRCHGDQGKTGIANPGSKDGTIPPLNPIDSSMVNKDFKTFATNIDLFIEHGSTPEGDSPSLVMTPFGDNKVLTPQQIADVIAYVISLNPAK
jgi:mono/diheme cytochrome c family protein